jgi:DTW domain-containing protein YfiP
VTNFKPHNPVLYFSMNNIEAYHQRRALAIQALEPRRRISCLHCRQPVASCYCSAVTSFDPGVKFVILIHPIEHNRRIATGRMSHLILQNSKLIRGYTFGGNAHVNALIEDPANQCMLLYPGQKSLNMSLLPQPVQVFDRKRQPVLFVVDGTWGTAKKMVNQSPNLYTLPRVQFTPVRESRFRVRKQPRPNFYSTIEAIHHSIELLAGNVGFDLSCGHHNHLLEMFDRLVEQQLVLAKAVDRRHRNPRPALDLKI